MAKRNSGGNVVDMQGTTAGSNSKVRSARIRAAFAQIAALEDDIDEMVAEHVEPLKKSRTKAWRELKKDLDMPRKVLEADYRVFKIARDAKRMDDGGDLILEQLKEVHEALHPGSTVDWVAALEGAEEE